MSSPDEIITELQRQFDNHYCDTFLFAPKFIQEALYIDSKLRLDGSIDTLNLAQLCDKVFAGVERSFLILGDSGSGKTTFALQLCQALWDKSGVDCRIVIPIYVYLPDLVTKLNQSDCNSEPASNVVKIFVDELGVHGIEKCKGQIVFILDSFDEIGSYSKRSKIVQNICTNTKSWLGEVSILTCSRPEAVPKLKRQEMFEFVKFGDASNRNFLEYTLEGLSGDMISDFLEKMDKCIIPLLRNCKDEELSRWTAWGALKNKIQDWKSGDYKQWFMDIPDLGKLSENPYILTLICQALPGIVLKLKNEEMVLRKLCKTRVGIFHSFTEQIFEYQAHRVDERPDNLKQGGQDISYRDWLIYFRAYAQNLAGKWFSYANEERVVKISDEETLDPSLVEPVLNISQLEKLEKDHMDLFPARLIHYEEKSKSGKLSKANPISMQNMRILRDACNGSILVHSTNEQNENEFKFIHRSMLEYFGSEQAFESSLAEYDLILGQNMDNSASIYGETGFGRALIKDRDILSQLVQRTSFEYKKILFKLIRVSKGDSKLHRISANAITILNKAHVCFSGQDYRDIQIQGADLRQSICAKTDFRGANLTSVQFGESYLVGAQFQGACLENVDFGEFPFLKLTSRLSSMVCYRDQESVQDNWVIGTWDRRVIIWNTLDEKLVLPECQCKPTKPFVVDTRLSLLDGKLAVWTESIKFPLYPLSTKMVTYEVLLLDQFPKSMFCSKHSLPTKEGEVGHVYIKFRPMDKCVFVYSSCHLEVHSYSPSTKSNTENFVTIGNRDPSRTLTFESIVDKSGVLLVACRENCGEKEAGKIIVYQYTEVSNSFEIIHGFTVQTFSRGTAKNGMVNEFGHLDRMLFKPDGSGLAIYNGPLTSIELIENFSEITTPVHSRLNTIMSLTFDKTGKYLAGSTDTTNRVMIWNVPSGTIHRQFEFSTMFYPTRFANPLSFSSDSKLLAFGGYTTTMQLKSIDEDPSTCDVLMSKSVDDIAVSNDGQVVVIGGDYYFTSSIFHYIEIFNFPFQASTGLCVRFPKNVVADTCLLGVIDSKRSPISKKIIVIQKADCRAIVICSNTGAIQQNFRFEEILEVKRDGLTCVNKQASLYCICFPTQGYFFWKIFENDNFQVVFQRNIDLDWITHIEAEILRFDYTGRYLQLVTVHSTYKPDLNKIILLDTKTKIPKELNVPVSADIYIPIKSVETDMMSQAIFLCNYSQLLIINPFDGTLSQLVEYNFNHYSKLYFDVFSTWLFAISRDVSSLVIFLKEESEWRLALEIPLWFETMNCVIYEKNDKISVLLGGQGDLCFLEFDKHNCHSWRLLWSMKHCHELTSLNSNVEGALGLSKRNAGVLKGLGAVGAPHKNVKSKYLAFSDWCQEIFGTARSKFHSPFIRTDGNNFLLSEDMWVVSLVGNLSKIRKWRGHVYFIVEGIKNNRRFITRIHLTYSREFKTVSIVVSPLVDTTPINNISWENSDYIEFVHLTRKLSAQQYGMSREKCEEFLRNIQSDMQVKLNYNVLTNNCGVWCEKQLKRVGREVRLKGFTAALIFPRVLELFKEMIFWKKSKEKVTS